MIPGHVRVRTLIAIAAVLACVPYLLFKVLWLTGLLVGVTSRAGVATMTDPRHVVGNLVTAALELVAAGGAVALTRPWGQRLPAWLVLGAAWLAAGLLAPIVLGLSTGILIQLASGRGTRIGSGDGLAWWVFTLIYGGFGVLGCCLAALLTLYVVERWSAWLRVGPRVESRLVAGICGAVMLAYALLLALWGLTGPDPFGGPAGFESVAQRCVLVVTGLLVAFGYLAPMLPGFGVTHPAMAAATTWVGAAVGSLAGPTHVLLSHDGEVRPAVLVSAVLATIASVWFSVAVWRSARRRVATGATTAARRGR